jgi:putative ABC transport system ATP-binding protein
MQPPIAELTGVHRRYAHGRGSVHALRGVSLAVRPGEFVAVQGPSGGGKSTLLALLAAVDAPDEGRVVVLGVDLTRATERARVDLRRHGVGVVFQAFHLMPSLSAAENVALPLALAGRPDPRRVAELLERVGLADRSRHYPSELSGGEQQRIAVARALVHRPPLIVADEPTGNLDSQNGERVLDLLDELRRAERSTLVIATHDPLVAGRADRCLTIRDGCIAGEPCEAGGTRA